MDNQSTLKELSLNDEIFDKEMLEKIPDSAKELLKIISQKAFFDLVRIYGGSHLSIPKKAIYTHEIAVLIGLDEFSKLSSIYGGEIIYLPCCRKSLAVARNHRILTDRVAGLSLREIAVKNNLTERGIQLILQHIRNKRVKNEPKTLTT